MLAREYLGHDFFLSEEPKPGLLKVTFNNPDSLNAIPRSVHDVITKTFEAIAEDETVRVVILTGAGRAFCAGGDVSNMEETYTPEVFKNRYGEIIRMIEVLIKMPQPVIAMVNGPAVGLGASIALSCDMVYASNQAVFADPHVRVGLVAGDGGALVWPSWIGSARAKEFLFTGRSVSAEKAESMGLISKCCETENLEPEVLKLADELLAVPDLALRFTKVAVNTPIRQSLESVLYLSAALEGMSLLSQDHLNLVQAFLQRRKEKPLD